jgi:hypothetical protein
MSDTTTLYVRLRRVGAIWHRHKQLLGDRIELLCGVDLKEGLSERSEARPDEGGLCKECEREATK